MCPLPLARPLLAPARATHKLPQDLCTGCLPCRKCPAENNWDKSLTQFLASGSVLPGRGSALAGCSMYSHTHRNLWRSWASPGLSPANSVRFF